MEERDVDGAGDVSSGPLARVLRKQAFPVVVPIGSRSPAGSQVKDERAERTVVASPIAGELQGD